MRKVYLMVFFSLFAAFSAQAAQESYQSFTYQGRLLDSSNNPILDNVTFKLAIVDGSKTCILYEETQVVDTSVSEGFFTLQVGSDTTDSKRSGDDPGLPMAKVMQNLSLITASNAGCVGGYTPSSGDARYLRVTINPASTGVDELLSPDIVISSMPSAIVAESVQGLDRSKLLDLSQHANLTQGNLQNLVDGSEASSLHHHDGRYVLKGSGSTQDLGSGIVHSTGQMAIGTSSPASGVEFEIESNNPTIRLDAIDGGSGTSGIEFTDNSGTNEASITVQEGTQTLVISTAGTAAMEITSGQEAIFHRAVRAGQYSDAQETPLVAELVSCGTTCVGFQWVNTNSNVIKFFDGTGAQAVGSGGGSGVTSVTASLPLESSGGSTPNMSLNLAADGLKVEGANLALNVSSDFNFSSNELVIASDGVTSAHILDGQVALADLDKSDVDTRYVNVNGDSMQGNLGIVNDAVTSIGPQLFLKKERSSTQVQDGDALGAVEFLGYDGASYAFSSRIKSNVRGNPSVSDIPSDLSFWTRPSGGGGPLQRMTIDPNGNVGIGRISPAASLDVAGSSGIRAEQICDETGANCKDISTGWSAGGGEANTASNLGSGIGVFETKSASDLQFRSIKAGSSKVTVTAGANTVNIDVNEANLSHSAMSDLGNDDHIQYLNINGRSGGQTVHGGTGASEKLTLNGSSTLDGDIIMNPSGGGKVGIGTSAPIAALQIVGASGDDGQSIQIDDREIKFRGDGTSMHWSQKLVSGRFALVETNSGAGMGLGGTERFSLKAGGNLGLGTSNPSANLHIYDPTGDADIRLSGSGGGSGVMRMMASTGDVEVGNLNSQDVHVIVNGARRMTVNDSDKVGIGTESPSARLHISKPSGGDEMINMENEGGGSVMMSFTKPTQNWRLGMDGSTGDFNIIDSTAGPTQLFIESGTGNVGIGTTTPNEKLVVEGRAKVKGGLDLPPGSTFQASLRVQTIALVTDFDSASPLQHGGSNIIHINSVASIGNTTIRCIEPGLPRQTLKVIKMNGSDNLRFADTSSCGSARPVRTKLWGGGMVDTGAPNIVANFIYLTSAEGVAIEGWYLLEYM